jgi:hypothetical protein
MQGICGKERRKIWAESKLGKGSKFIFPFLLQINRKIKNIFKFNDI